MSSKPKPTGVFNAKKAWAIFFAIFIAGVALAWSQNKIVPVLPFIQSDLNVSAQVAGWISGLFNVMGIVLAFPAVGIARKFGARKGGIAALACALIGAIIGFIAPDQTVLMVSRVIEGFGIGLIAVIAPSVVAAWFPVKKRSFPMGIWSAWQCITVAGVFLFTGNIIGPDLAWKNMYIIGFVILAIAIVAFIAVVKMPPATQNHADIEDSSASMFSVLKIPSAWFITILFFAFGIACMALVSWVSGFWEQTVGWDVLDSNKLIGLMYAGEVATCALAGFLLTKIPTLAAQKKFVVVFSFVYTLCFFMLYTVTDPSLIIFFCVLYVICEGVFVAGMWSFVTLIPKNPALGAAVIAMATIGQNLGMMLGSPIAGAILDATVRTGWNYLAILVAICMVIASVCFIFLKLHHDKEDE